MNGIQPLCKRPYGHQPLGALLEHIRQSLRYGTEPAEHGSPLWV